MAIRLSSNQMAFARELVAKTGLDKNVVVAWMIAEEPPGAQSGYKGTQDWLNVGITDSGPRGAGNPAWQDPTKAADLTAAWMKGQASVPGFGSAAAGIRKIPQTAGRPASDQLAAIQNSGWASGGYPGLDTIYHQVANSGISIPAGPITRPGGQPSGSGGGSSGGDVKNVLNAYQKLRDTPRTAPPGTKNPFQWFMASFTGNWAALNQSGAGSGGGSGGSSPSTPSAPGTAQGKIFGGPAVWGRTDQGVDVKSTPGTPIHAIAGGVVSAIVSNWYAGQPYVVIDSPGLPHGATGIYYAEQISPSVKKGDKVAAGQQIGTYASSGTAMEIGFSRGTSVLTPYTAADYEKATPGGTYFREFLRGLGIKL